jgi:hypothetical protein
MLKTIKNKIGFGNYVKWVIIGTVKQNNHKSGKYLQETHHQLQSSRRRLFTTFWINHNSPSDKRKLSLTRFQLRGHFAGESSSPFYFSYFFPYRISNKKITVPMK